MTDTVSGLAQKLRPFWLRDVDGTSGRLIISSGGGGGGVTDHGLLSGLTDDDHLHYLTTARGDGRYYTETETDSWRSAHIANADAHHARVHALDGSDHTGLLSWSKVNKAGSALTDIVTRPHSALTGIGPNDHHNQQHNIVGGDHTLSGAKWSVVGATGTNVLGLMTPSSYPGAGEALLKTDTSGYLALVRLTATDRLRTNLLDTAAGHMTLQPAVDLLLDPGSSLIKLQPGAALQSHNYASQLTGMRVTNAGEGDFRYLYTDEMHAKSFIADLEQALAGGQIISKSVTVMSTALTVPAPGNSVYLYVDDLPSAPNMAVFEAGDVIRLRQFSRAGGGLSVTDCWGTVSGYLDQADGTQRWSFTRSTAPNAGAMATGAMLAKDLIVLDYGVSGNGFYEVNAIDGLRGLNSPYLQFVRWTDHPATGKKLRVRLGNLRGVFNQDEYGLFAGTGTSNDDRYLRLSDYAAGNGINNLPLTVNKDGVKAVEISDTAGISLYTSSAEHLYRRINFYDGAALRGDIRLFVGSQILQINKYNGGSLRMDSTSPDTTKRATIEAFSSDIYSQVTINANQIWMNGQSIWVVGGWNIGNTRYLPDGVNALYLNDTPISTPNDRWGVVPYVDGSGVLEVGKYVDFHGTDNEYTDYNVRLTASDTLLSVSTSFASAGNISAGGSINAGGISAASVTTTGPINAGAIISGAAFVTVTPSAWTGAFQSQANPSNYGYLDFSYAGTLSGYLLWSNGEMGMYAYSSRIIRLNAGGGVAINNNAVEAGYALDVNGPIVIRSNGKMDGAWYLKEIATQGALAGYLPVWFDGTNLKARLPNGTIKTISWS